MNQAHMLNKCLCGKKVEGMDCGQQGEWLKKEEPRIGMSLLKEWEFYVNRNN